MTNDDPTRRYYDEHASEFAARTMSRTMDEAYPRFLERLTPGAHILDAGCGPGRDSKAFLEMGYRVSAFDASTTLAKMAEQLTGQPVRVMRFQDLDDRDVYDAVWASASLLHVSASEIDDVLFRLTRSLRVGGILYLTVKFGDGERINIDGRLFNDYTPPSLRATLARQSLLDVIDVWQQGDTRRGFEDQQWTHGLARRRVLPG
ncbi:MAG TPA: class I SAM-dependent methyltransferase [Tepidisphaeraceae bacterium]|nr:class I SAM-dependent methyltransferase [Tepidisphaeraceae bacterium]